jgi:hypothetical protein
MKNLKRLLASAVIAGLAFFSVNAQNDTSPVKDDKPEASKRILRLFEDDEPLEMSLEFDLRNFMRKKDKTQTFDGILTLFLTPTDTMDRKVTLKYRGQSRYVNCGYPPVEINFRKAVYFDSDTAKVKKMKLVHQCQRGSLYEEYILREYLVYRLFNVFTDTSYRVRLLRINYIDSKGAQKPFILNGFFIEPKGILAARTNNHIIKSTSLGQRDMDPGMMNRIAIFNYMISNWDWSVPGQHNIDILKSRSFGTSMLGIPVPFDFDLAGLVNAEYAIPPAQLGIANNRVRIFRGMCRSREDFRKELGLFLRKKQELYAVINDFPLLGKGSKKDMTILLDQFFEQIEKPRSLEILIDQLLRDCQKL